MSLPKFRKTPVIKYFCAYKVLENLHLQKIFWKKCRTIIVHLNIKTILKNKLFSKNKSRCEMGFVDFPNRNTNTSKIFYYSQSLMICLVEQKSHFQLAKMTKMDIVKH